MKNLTYVATRLMAAEWTGLGPDCVNMAKQLLKACGEDPEAQVTFDSGTVVGEYIRDLKEANRGLMVSLKMERSGKTFELKPEQSRP